MEIQYGKQIKINDFKDKIIDLFLCVENHEKRSYTLYNTLLKTNKIDNQIVFCYKEIDYDENVLIKKIKTNNHTEVINILENEIQKINKDTINIVIDYSCMTKSWYYSIILYLKNKENRCKNIISYFSYTPSKYIEPKKPKPNRSIAPLPGKYVVPTDKPKALIVCLGYEQNKAEGIIEHLDPKKYYLFYTKPASDKKFVNTIENNNQNILREKVNNIITYSFDDLINLEKELTRLYFYLKDEYSIIIAPLGPKPFSFISMMLSVKYSDIDIWRVGSGNDINEYYNEPIDDKSFIICEVYFKN
ncbi:hypothetical protein ACJOV8_017780 [Formosa sp. 3Alg 14/1]|uniref:hypothetical protein n=1 Tax=Formosa TaxID=225842 RepID=UPI000824AAFA|nr:hypothetical protein [Formosa haliotis]